MFSLLLLLGLLGRNLVANMERSKTTPQKSQVKFDFEAKARDTATCRVAACVCGRVCGFHADLVFWRGGRK